MTVVVGIDEVGRGSFAGPLVVVAAAFLIQGDWDPASKCPTPGVKDSKKYTGHKSRSVVAEALRSCETLLAAGCGQIEAEEINRIGMGKAMKLAISNAVSGVEREGVLPDLILLDGNERVPNWRGLQKNTPKADNLWWPVSAASVLAKVYRDGLMIAAADEFPEYDFANNMGYGTPKHIDALRKIGPCRLHRTSFIQSSLASDVTISIP